MYFLQVLNLYDPYEGMPTEKRINTKNQKQSEGLEARKEKRELFEPKQLPQERREEQVAEDRARFLLIIWFWVAE